MAGIDAGELAVHQRGFAPLGVVGIEQRIGRFAPKHRANLPGEIVGADGRSRAWVGGQLVPVTTLADEKRINTFMRLQSPGVIAQLRKDFPELPEQPDAKTVFTKLRELRNKW